ncbi:Protein asteroid -like protein 1 [Channa argus]|uniref:Protein asteroid-like protein 1 n=1 Tax=Channa argus TaxID=215402 RepID=A0A6G1PQF2_CHAAH|nr:Protein asteroid -like protein 1 [Channa argus]
MGVQGLSTLLDNSPQIYREVRFMRSRLVIDGCNLLYQLYFKSGLDENYGGEYASFGDLVEKFVTVLKDCRITPYVVFDGAFDFETKKLVTHALRTEDKLKKAHQAAVGGRKELVLPSLAELVFKQTLARLEVPVAQCYGEADLEIAALASKWQCPVLSNDSDFYIFGLPAGLLPINHFKWEAVEQSGSRRYIPCKSYNTSSFCIFFNIQHQLLPTFAALAGNDYVNLRRMGKSIRWAQFAPAGSAAPNRLQGLLHWLKDFEQPREALKAALAMMGELTKKQKVEVLQRLRLGMEEYKIPPSSLERFFIHGVAPEFPAEEEVAGRVPHWMRLRMTQARLYKDILNVLLLERSRCLSIPVDHSAMPTACLTSRPLRQVMYGLLLGGGKDIRVKEPEIFGLQLKCVNVQPIFKGVIQQLPLNSLDRAEPSERLQVLLEALGVTEDSLSRLPPGLQLPVAVTCYWLREAQPPPDKTLLKALLLGLSNGDTLRHGASLKIQQKHFKVKLDMDVVHALNQWQVCLKDSVHLNQLLGCPLPEPQIARLYEGTLVHRLVHMMRTGGKLKFRVKSDLSSLKLYQTTLSIIHQFHAQETSTSTETGPQRQPLDDLTANLQQLFFQCDDEETVTEVKSAARAQEDLHLDQMLSVRTRYRIKERNNRCNNPEICRKEERRGWDIL